MAPGDLREQLNELWKTTVDQFDEIKEVVVHNSHVGRKKLDAAFLKRQQDRLFQDLGELMFVAAMKTDLPLNAEAQRVVERIKDVSARLKVEENDLGAMRNPVDEHGPAVQSKPAPAVEKVKVQADAKSETDDVNKTQAPVKKQESAAQKVVASPEKTADKVPASKPVEAKTETAPGAETAAKKTPSKKKSTKTKTTLDAASEDGHKSDSVDGEEEKPKRRRRRPRKKAEPIEN